MTGNFSSENSRLFPENFFNRKLHLGLPWEKIGRKLKIVL